MGPCASATISRHKRELPLIFPVFNPSSRQFSSTQNEFQLKLSNVTILPVQSTKIDLTFSIEKLIDFNFQKNSAVTQKYIQPQSMEKPQKYEIKWNQVNKVQFNFNDHQLVEKYLTVRMKYENSAPFQIIKISLYQIVHGPYHHNIQIPLNPQPFRLLFDAKISHIFQVNLTVRELKLNTLSKINAAACHFTIKAIVFLMLIQNQDETLMDSSPSYPLRSGMNTLFEQNQPFYKQERPKNSKLKVQYSYSMEETPNFSIVWTEKQCKARLGNNQMPSLTFDVNTHDITHYFTQIIIWSFDQRQNTANYICESKIPLWKMLDKQFGSKTQSLSVGLQNVDVQTRKIKLNQKVYCHQENIGNIQFEIDLKNEKLIEQAKYCSRTQDGIVNMRPASLNINIKNSSEVIHELWKYSEEIQMIFKKVEQKNVVDRYESEISEILHSLNQKLSISTNEILYSQTNKSETLINNQKIFIQMVQRLYPFIENAQNPGISQLCWSIVIKILTRAEFRLENLSLKGKYITRQALQVLKRKKDLAMKYHQSFCKLLIYALKSYGLYHKEGSMISEFIAFAFFRNPVFRDYFFEVVNYENTYAQMQKKLVVFQTEIEPTSSFGSSFAQIKGDWKSHFYDELNNSKSQEIFKTLRQGFKSKKWFNEISYKDEVFYDFISLLFEILSKHSAERSDKWKYIEGYSKVVAIIMTELKEKEVNKYNLGLIRSSIQVLQNEHLLTPMLPLICDKTNSYDGDKVQIVLDLIQEYLQMVTKNKTTQLPSTFNQNYFFKIMRVILEGDHYNSINKLLIIIYNYFEFFNSNGRYQIAMYLMGKLFFKLYYHWSKEIRNTFYVILQIKIKHIVHQKANQITKQFLKVIGAVKIIEKIYRNRHLSPHCTHEKVLYKKLKLKLQEKLRKKQGNFSKSSSYSNNRSEYALENILKMIEDESVLQEQIPNIKQQHSNVEMTPKKLQINVFANESLEIPGKAERTYSGGVPSVEQILINISSELPGESQQQSKKDQSLKRRRRPSLFLDPKVSPISTTQYSKINNQLHDLSELTENEINQIGYAQIQMLQLSENISKFTKDNGKLPTNEFLLLKSNEITA